MAKKLNKLWARVETLEGAFAKLFSTKKPSPKRKKTTKAKTAKTASRKPAKAAKPVKAATPKKAARKTAKKRLAKTMKRPAAKKAPVASAAPSALKPAKKATRKKRVHVPPPTIGQIAPSGAPNFVQPLDKV